MGKLEAVSGSQEVDFALKAKEGLLEWVEASKTQYLDRMRAELGNCVSSKEVMDTQSKMINQFTGLVESRVAMYFDGLSSRGVDFSPAFKPMTPKM